MYQQINAQFAGMTKQFTDAVMQANGLALENAERVFGLQVKTIEANMAATADFITEFSEVRAPEELKDVMPRGLQLVKENAERTLHASQEAFGETLKTQQAIGQIAKAQMESAGEQVKQTAAKATKAAK